MQPGAGGQTFELDPPTPPQRLGHRTKDDTMAVITEHEEHQINAANAAGLTPVVFVHGLWLLPSSWDRWRTLFEQAGYTTLAPDWPDDPDTVEEANEHPEVFAHKSVGRSLTTSRT
jgi:non-heme chloroperoxidase